MPSIPINVNAQTETKGMVWDDLRSVSTSNEVERTHLPSNDFDEGEPVGMDVSNGVATRIRVLVAVP